MNGKSRTEYALINTFTGITGYAVNTLMGFICRMVFVRCLADEYLGINGLFTNILSMLSLAELGIGSAITFALYTPIANKDNQKIASLMKFYGTAYKIIAGVVAIVGAAMLPFLDFIIQEPPAIKESLHVIYLLYLLNTVSTYLFSYRSALLTATQEHYIVVGVNYVFTICQSVLQIIFLWVTKEYMAYLIIQIVSGFIYNITISQIAKKKYPFICSKEIQPLEKAERRSLVKNVQALTVWKLSGLLVNNTDHIITTYFNGLVMVGYASNYTLLSGMLNTMLNLVFSGITASVGNFNATESQERKLQLFNTINLINFWLFGWAAIGIFVVSGDLVGLLYGSRFVLPGSIPFVIALNFYMVGMQSAVWTYQTTMGLFRQGRYLLLLTATLNVVLSIWLGKKWGLFGILFATAIARGATNTWYDPYKVFKYGIGVPVGKYFIRYFKYAVLVFLCGGVCNLLCGFLPFSGLANVLLKCLICSLIPNGVFLVTFYRNPEFQFILSWARRITATLLRRLHRPEDK